MTAYVCGFVFDKNSCVVLIQKKTPQWQAGKLNGVGGKIEDHETPQEAMRREFLEEAGVEIPPENWVPYHKESWKNGNSVNFLTAMMPEGQKAVTMTEERIVTSFWRAMSAYEWEQRKELYLYNLNYLIPMAHTFLNVKPHLLSCHAS